MMLNRGHTVYHYGVEGSVGNTCVSLYKSEHERMFPPHDYKAEYYPVKFDPAMPYWKMNNARQNQFLKEYAKPSDLICLIGGTAQLPAVDGLSQAVVEYGIGYYGTCPDTYKCYESYAHMHTCYGQSSRDPDGKFTDTVVPNYFDLADFDFNESPDDYILFIGRLIDRKGIHVAIDACKRAGRRLVVAGQGSKRDWPDHVTFVGFADKKRRNDLMRRATALICPTLYVEPFGGVNVEAQLCGTPVITTDFGAFTETVEHGYTGFRCTTMQEFVDAIDLVNALDRHYIHERAKRNYSLESVAPLYESFFDRVHMLHNTPEGWYGNCS